MFSAVKKVLKNIQKIDEGKLLRDILLENTQLQYDILKLNTEKQLYEEGVFADGKPTGEYAPFSYQYKKTEAGALGRDTRTDHITYKDTGEMYDSARMKVSNKGFIISMDTVKGGDDLEKRDGKLVGLTEDSLGEVRVWVLPLARAEVLQKIFKK